MLFRPAVQHTHQQFGQILLRKEIAQLVGPAFETHGCVPHRLGDESAHHGRAFPVAERHGSAEDKNLDGVPHPIKRAQLLAGCQRHPRACNGRRAGFLVHAVEPCEHRGGRKKHDPPHVVGRAQAQHLLELPQIVGARPILLRTACEIHHRIKAVGMKELFEPIFMQPIGKGIHPSPQIDGWNLFGRHHQLVLLRQPPAKGSRQGRHPSGQQ